VARRVRSRKANRIELNWGAMVVSCCISIGSSTAFFRQNAASSFMARKRSVCCRVFRRDAFRKIVAPIQPYGRMHIASPDKYAKHVPIPPCRKNCVTFTLWRKSYIQRRIVRLAGASSKPETLQRLGYSRWNDGYRIEITQTRRHKREASLVMPGAARLHSHWRRRRKLPVVAEHLKI
jgi:hypothetical protein